MGGRVVISELRMRESEVPDADYEDELLCRRRRVALVSSVTQQPEGTPTLCLWPEKGVIPNTIGDDLKDRHRSGLGSPGSGGGMRQVDSTVVIATANLRRLYSLSFSKCSMGFLASRADLRCFSKINS